MFLFLSKLLPLFVYPLGLSCLCILVALICLRPKSRKTPYRFIQGCLIVAIVLLWFSSTPFSSKILLGSLERQFEDYSAIETLPNADAIVVLGGATHGIAPPRLYPELGDAGDRLIQAVRLYRLGKAPKILLSGGKIQWTDSEVPIGSEAEDMQTLLHLFGIADADLILEPDSLNTYQNAVNSQKLLNQNHLKRILLVTSAFHMPRALAIFTKLGIDAIPAPTDFRTIGSLGGQHFSVQQFLLNLLPSADHLYKTSMGLKERIGIWVYRWRGWA
ncbi:MAG: YdcF family protein [Prochlorotrichaceae cyanobacterium]|jgi:uncharacterized SAM-binding protein YcdF (DUF218 family)